MEVGMLVVCGISLGLIYIYKSVIQAGEDMETFDSTSIAQKLKKPEGWKVGKMPAGLNPSKKHMQIKNAANAS